MEEGRYEEALQCHYKSVKVRDLSTDKDLAPAGSRFQNLALCYLAKGQLPDAVTFMEKAERMWICRVCYLFDDEY